MDSRVPACQRRDETKENGSLRSLCSMASVISGLVLLVCFCSGRVPQVRPDVEMAVVIVIREQCYHPELNVTRLKELAILEVKEINRSWTVEFIPEDGK